MQFGASLLDARVGRDRSCVLESAASSLIERAPLSAGSSEGFGDERAGLRRFCSGEAWMCPRGE